MKNIPVIVFLLVMALSGCGGDGGSGGGSHSQAPMASVAPMNLRPVKANKKKAVKPANINFFADQNLTIPPFNAEARNIAVELFVENGKEQRDPFRNLYEDMLTDTKTDISSQNISGNEEGTMVLLEHFTLSQLKLTGIIWSAGREKALFQSPDGQPTSVNKDDRISKVKALVKEITHDRVLLEIPGKKGETGKMMEFTLVRASGPYQIQYDKLRPDQRGIRVRLRNWKRK
ncbi:MAG: pilus assembly protein PilP [Deltaproteobacteria bacterium]|nr:pilus assembly protein PilP [Deltaproteobacteria bacterium]